MVTAAAANLDILVSGFVTLTKASGEPARIASISIMKPGGRGTVTSLFIENSSPNSTA